MRPRNAGSSAAVSLRTVSRKTEGDWPAGVGSHPEASSAAIMTMRRGSGATCMPYELRSVASGSRGAAGRCCCCCCCAAGCCRAACAPEGFCCDCDCCCCPADAACAHMSAARESVRYFFIKGLLRKVCSPEPAAGGREARAPRRPDLGTPDFRLRTLESIFPALVGTQELQGNRVRGQRTNGGKGRAAEREGQEQVPEARRKLAPVRGREQVRVAQHLDAPPGQREGPAEQRRADRVGRQDYRHERQEGIVDERARVDRDLVESEDEGGERGEYGVQADERREGYEDADREGERRPLRRVVQSEQAAEGAAKHCR